MDVETQPDLRTPPTCSGHRFEIGDPAWQLHLAEHGYCVVKTVADEPQLHKGRALFWDGIEGLHPGVCRNDASTWRLGPPPPAAASAGSTAAHRVGWALDFVWPFYASARFLLEGTGLVRHALQASATAVVVGVCYYVNFTAPIAHENLRRLTNGGSKIGRRVGIKVAGLERKDEHSC